MNKAVLVVRSLVGFIFVVFGLNVFFHFIPMPAEAGKFMGALGATGYFFQLLKATEIVAGAMLLANKLPALGLVLLAPIVVQNFLFSCSSNKCRNRNGYANYVSFR